MKQYLIAILGGFILLPGCKKSTGVTGPLDKKVAYLSFTNVNGNAKTVNVFVDNTQLNNVAAVATNGTVTGTYLGIYPGDHLLEVKDNTAPGAFYHSTNFNVTPGNSYSYFVYDTLKAGRFKGILLTADRKINPASANSKVRFINFAAKAPVFDVWFVRRVAAVAKDSIKVFALAPSLTSVATPDPVALSTYTDVASSQAAGAAGPGSGATDYIIKLKLANTNTIITSSAATPLINGRTYTFFTRGVYGTASYGLSSFLNN